MIQISYILPVISGLMHKQISVGVIVMIALTAIGTNQAVQSQLERGNDPVGGDIVQPQFQGNDPVGGDIVQPQFRGNEPVGGVIRQLSDLKAAAPIAISGDSVYIAWPANTTGNDEVMFRASNNGGTTFADKINLSNSSDTESQDVEIAADGSNVVVTWWERNQTAEEPIVIVSTDNGVTFGPILRLTTNGTVGQVR
jgi:hypothetical protein